MSGRVVTEGRSDAALLKAILEAAGVMDVNVLDAGGKSSAKSLGISFALSGQRPVAVVLDAETSSEGNIQEQLVIFDDLQPHHLHDECRLFLATPTLEGELFPDGPTFSSMSGVALDPQQSRDFEVHRKQLVGAFVASGRLSTSAIDRLVSRPLVRDLLTFLRGALEEPKANSKRAMRGRRAATA